MLIICGNSIAEVEQDLAMAKMAMASGASVGLGGNSIEDAERALHFLNNAGPSFLFGMIGARFSSPLAPWLLWGIHLAAAGIVAASLPRTAHSSRAVLSISPVTIPQALAGVGFGKAGDGADGAGIQLLSSGEFFTGIQPQLLEFFFPHHTADPKAAAGDLQPGEPCALGIPGDLIDPGSKFCRICFGRSVPIQKGDQGIDAL